MLTSICTVCGQSKSLLTQASFRYNWQYWRFLNCNTWCGWHNNMMMFKPEFLYKNDLVHGVDFYHNSIIMVDIPTTSPVGPLGHCTITGSFCDGVSSLCAIEYSRIKVSPTQFVCISMGYTFDYISQKKVGHKRPCSWRLYIARWQRTGTNSYL